jgi:hypothetical protein
MNLLDLPPSWVAGIGVALDGAPKRGAHGLPECSEGEADEHQVGMAIARH